MGKQDLQIFIEKNAGKYFGHDYIFESSIIHTRFWLAREPHAVEVCLHLPWGQSFMNCFDNREVRNNIEFYEWLVDDFFPLAEKAILKRKEEVALT